MKSKNLLILGILCTELFCFEAKAKITSGLVTGGTALSAEGRFVVKTDPIGTVGQDDQQSANLFAFGERQNFLLTSPLTVNIPGGDVQQAGIVIPAGSVVSSYYIVFDPKKHRTIKGTVHFSTSVLGIITSRDLLTASDLFGNPTAVYQNPDLRGLEAAAGDAATLADAQTVSVSFSASSPGDYIRVITAPESDWHLPFSTEPVEWPKAQGGNGHYYQAIAYTNGVSWFQASLAATNMGGYLATLTSASEDAFVYKLVQTNKSLWNMVAPGQNLGPWLGGQQLAGSVEPKGGWNWVTHESATCFNWASTKPANLHPNYDRLHFYSSTNAPQNSWSDLNGDNFDVRGFVVEFDGHPGFSPVAIVHAGLPLSLRWSTHLGFRYILQQSDMAGGGNWISIGTIDGTGQIATVPISKTASQQFYRVLAFK